MKTEEHVNIIIYSLLGDGCVVDYSEMTLTIDDNDKIDKGCGGGGFKAFEDNAKALRWIVDFLDTRVVESDQVNITFEQGTVVSRSDYQRLQRQAEERPRMPGEVVG